MQPLAPELERRRREHLYRRRRVSDGPQGPEMRLDGRSLISFCGNDYLGLANHPRVIEVFREAAGRYGVGSGAAHLVNGHSAAHHALEEELAAFTGRQRALLFSTGYMANTGLIATLLGRGDTVYQDRLNHASLLDGGLLSRARLKRYAHADPLDLAARMAGQGGGEALVATDGVFSMDGDIAPLPELAAQCRRRGAWLLVDDAHGLGVLGPGGRGSLAHFGLDADQVPILMGTLGKALGTAGAFVAGSEELIETLIQRARSYIFTTAAPPALAEATRAALALARDEGWRRQRLGELIARFRAGAEALGLPLMPSQTPIQPLLAGSSARALDWARQLEDRGVLVTPIRPPTVPEGGARLRVTLSAIHDDRHLEQLLDALAELRGGDDAAPC
ncbi:MAG: 8-amino-7-oxononanoate synthase [Candidatus Sedimenticola endophacoides]|uniref:8-amino-7-oxononanoate synthase n=1 Tax=Candidatus Sedimenticola endophacoides TaxID=2548426 RepID=A0A6N4DVF6_9GAMM|nr:MAG: 8-amino-7-oxononanoate synthase [Candidatus Sedimenticola endophacoides]OQX35563.1 MAG: 8-amino-7-oxononanoate synthase [Candidatus Sedimenticola endophacoides]OQX40495.1 MAG: 8-amino-7-oxononanoate synthase [Candidatus Sedimenticola endophacoides]PUD99195.1 MAG: 8-amino-7-oxononanoate synthase [Candidatus Sedimenticola endophacoides]PUE02479.1 MAG: 8-amino-7-oxononanoate synthase [Candidatus Sedimenticola endophacoides]